MEESHGFFLHHCNACDVIAKCNYWNVNYITFQWFTIALFSKYTKYVNMTELSAILHWKKQWTETCTIEDRNQMSFHDISF